MQHPFQIVKALLHLTDEGEEDEKEVKCVSCQSTDSEIEIIKPDAEWYNKHIRTESRNKSPAQTSKIESIDPTASPRPEISMEKRIKIKVEHAKI